MGNVIDFLRRKEPENYVLSDGKKVRLPSLSVLKKLQDAPLLKEHRLLMREFPSADLEVKLDNLNSFLSARLKVNKSDEFQIRRIKDLMKEIEELNNKISREVSIIYAAYQQGDLHIQELYDDLYSKTIDTKRMNRRIAGLQETKKKVDIFLLEELEKDKLIQKYCQELYDKAVNLRILCSKLVDGSSRWNKFLAFIKRERLESRDEAIQSWAEGISRTVKNMNLKAKKLTNTMKIMISLYNRTIKKQKKLVPI